MKMREEQGKLNWAEERIWQKEATGIWFDFHTLLHLSALNDLESGQDGGCPASRPFLTASHDVTT